MAKKTNPNAGKPGYDKYGVKLVSQRRKEEQAKENRKKIIESRNARDKQIRDNASQKAQAAKIKETIGYSESSSTSKPKSSTPKREKQSVASSVTDAKIKKLDTSIKGENIKAKKERSLSESDKQKLAKLQKMKDRADKKQSRKDESIERLAFRMGDKATFQDAAALKQKRGEARKQYLRNFASQLARGEQAAPTKGFGEGDGNPAGDATLAGTSKEVATKKEAVNADSRNYLSMLTPPTGNSFIDDSSYSIDYDKGVSGLNKNADSDPSSFMKQEYRKKRGY
jgi:hypothetical protein